MAKRYKKFDHFADHLRDHDDLSGLHDGVAKKADWAPYAVALGAMESAVEEGKPSKKVRKRHKQAIKAVRKLAKHAGGKKAVRPPKKQKQDVAAKIAATPNVLPFEQARAMPALQIAASPAATPRPTALDEPRDASPDELTLVSGIGPKLEGMLNELGFFHFDQIAAWTPAEVEWVETYLQFKGRITREDWIGQAAALAKGGRDEYVRVFGKEPR